MKDTKKYVFAGARAYVLRDMMEKGLDIRTVWVMKDSFLHNMLKEDPFIAYTVISSKGQLLDEIEKTDFDVLISNGCKYILPISQLKPAQYINIHPSPLPDLRGNNPINAAFLFDRSCGATCHVMDDGIDTGSVISQVVIPMTEDLDAAILYRLCFKAEVVAFDKALQRNFRIMEQQPTAKDPIYYSTKPEDRLVEFEKGADYILRQVKAFGYKGKGLYFEHEGKPHRFFRAGEITNPFVLETYREVPDRHVALAFDDALVLKLEDRMLRFDQVEYKDDEIKEGDHLESAQRIGAPSEGNRPFGGVLRCCC